MMKMNYKEDTVIFLRKIADTFGEEIAKKFSCVVDSQCAPVELEDGKSAIHLEFVIIEPTEK